MNSLQKALLPLRLVGLRNGLRSVLYAARRDRLDARYRATGQDGASLRPGRLFGAEATPGGARFRFEQYELNVRFLAEPRPHGLGSRTFGIVCGGEDGVAGDG